MNEFRILEIKKSLWEGNDQRAVVLRADLERQGVFLLNVMSSPGSGKTSTLVRTIAALKDRLRMGVLEADLDSDVDARTISDTGVRVIQVHTGGMCHLDADMTRQSLEGLGLVGLDLVILENVGNLICTAEYDTGAASSVMILSVPEGHDKPLKYPHMFSVVDVLLINKIDVMEHFDFDLEAVTARVKQMNPKIQVFPVSAKTGEGMTAWAAWLSDRVAAWQSERGEAQ